jgi:hypothetical protein
MMAVMTVMTVLALALALLPLGLGAGPPQHQHLLMMDCEPSTQSNWTSWCFGQEFLEGVHPCRKLPTMQQQIVCHGERLVAVHRQTASPTEPGMPGVISLNDVLWLHSPCCYVPPKPGGPKPGWQAALGGALTTLRPAFANGSLAGIFIGDELDSAGVSVANISAVASLIKRTLAGTDAWVATNADVLAFGCDPMHYTADCAGPGAFSRPLLHFPGSYLDFGSIPIAIDFVSIDLYGSDTCLRTLPASTPCGYKLTKEFGSEHCIARECEAELVMAWYTERVFPLLAPHQRVWVIPGLFGNSNATSDAGNHTQQQAHLMQSLDAYTAWMQREPRIGAMAPWHWFSRSSVTAPEFALGAKEFPELVASLQAFGRGLKGSNKTAK